MQSGMVRLESMTLALLGRAHSCSLLSMGVGVAQDA